MDQVRLDLTTIFLSFYSLLINLFHTVNDTTKTATFARGYLDQRRLKCLSTSKDDKQDDLIVVLACLVVFCFFFGMLLSFAIIKFLIRRNGHNPNDILRVRKRQTLESDEAGKNSSSVTSVSHHVNNNADQGAAAAGDQELEEKTTSA